MYIAERIRQIREQKSFSQGDIENRTGLKRCYISRVENGHIVPAIETLEKIARALEVQMYQFFYENNSAPQPANQIKNGRSDWASQGKGRRLFGKIGEAVSRMNLKDRELFIHMAKQFVNGKRHQKIPID